MSVIKYKDPITGNWLTASGVLDNSSADNSIPFYVRNEAERVASVVQSRQNANTITFLACSDIHYYSPDNATTNTNAVHMKEAVVSMGQAMGIIRERCHIDFAAMFGDMVWENGETKDEILDEMRFVNACLHKAYSGIPQFRMEGNHDDGQENGTALTAGELFANIGAWNDNAVYGNREYGYCYRDFDGVKLRVICLNSSENSSGSGFMTSTEQVTWLANALNLSNKGADWRSIILSHHPLDWGKAGGKNPVDVIKTSTGLIASFHGHIHNFLSGTVTDTELPRIAIPNAGYSRENQYGETYGVNWKESTTYSKIPGTAENTSFCVITIDLAARRIYADHYGAGYDRIIPYDGATVTTYTVSNNLINVSNSNSGSAVSEGTAYSATITANTGYTLTGGTVKVTMGGVDITATAYSGGKITITNVTGDIIITASAVAEQTGPAYTNRVRTSIDTDGSVYNDTGYQEGYRLNSSGTTSASDGAVNSGFIPYNGQVIRVYGSTSSNHANNGNYVVMYNSDFSKHTVQSGSNWVNYGAVWTELDGKYMLTIDPAAITNAATKTALAEAAYIRVSQASCTAADFVVTLDEPIECGNCTNLVTTSIDPATGEVYNGCGYKDDVYGSGAGEGSTAAPDFVLTGLIAYGNDRTAPIYIMGADVDTSNSRCRILGFTSSREVSFQSASGNNISTYFNVDIIDVVDKYYMLTPTSAFKTATGFTDYLRFSLIGEGKNLIITIDEPIE